MNYICKTGVCLAKFFGNSPEFWLNLQKTHDLDIARDQASDLSGIKPVAA